MGSESKRASSEPFRPPPAEDWNNAMSAGEAWSADRLTQRGPGNHKTRPTDFIKVKNNSGADRAAGEILGIDDKLLTNLTRERPWVGSAAPNIRKAFGILPRPIASGKIGDLQIGGAAIATVDIQNASHTRAKVIDGDYNLQSSNFGPISLIIVPGTTGDVDCLVFIPEPGPMTDGYLFKAPGGGIPGRSVSTAGSATCDLYYIDQATKVITAWKDDSNVQLTETVHHVFSKAISGDNYITAKSIFQVIAADAEDC